MKNEEKVVETNNRIIWIDIAKGYGIILVILGHLGVPFVVSRALYSFHLPLFFFLSGYVFSDKEYNFIKFLKRKVRSILKPYFVFGVINLLFIFLMMFTGAHKERNVSSYIEHFIKFLIQKRYTTLWFLSSLFYVNIIYYILSKVFKERYRLKIFISVIILPSIGLFYYKIGGSALPWNIDVCFIAIPFFCIGNQLKYNELLNNINDSSLIKKVLFLTGFLSINLFTVYINLKLTGNTLEMFHMSYGNPPITLVSALAGIMWMIILSMFSDFKIIKFIGRNSLIYFTLHQDVIIPVVQKILKTLSIFQNISTMEMYVMKILCELLFILVINTWIVLLINNTKLKKIML